MQDNTIINNNVRTRYAPSPTGNMHIGNLRTALYEYLIAKSFGGKFILRIEDTDKSRYCNEALDLIYETLEKVGINCDEGPNNEGKYGPYVQSDRIDIYREYAKKLIDSGNAYYCFCTEERLKKIKENNDFATYDRHCRGLSENDIKSLLEKNIPYVIRQKVPLKGETSFTDAVYGKITINNKEIEDQILIKADGYPTYNFANVIDDHLMKITHVVRGCEYLTSTPKYNLLYKSFGWEPPLYIHLPLIMGKNTDGTVEKLSKRHGAVSFKDLTNLGYLPQAIINYVALLGWCPRENREIFTLNELEKVFEVERIGKSPAVFDYDKLKWFNSEYIKNMSLDNFIELSLPYIESSLERKNYNFEKIASLLKDRISIFSEIPEKIAFLNKCNNYSRDLFTNKKSKTDEKISLIVLKKSKETLNDLSNYSHEDIYMALKNLAIDLNVKINTVMWPIRVALSGLLVTPGGCTDLLEILGREESINRISAGIEKILNEK